MRALEAEGTRIEIPECCGGCGKVCTDKEAIDHLHRWNEILHDCSFCGKPIRIASMKLDHVHKSKYDEEGWGVTNTYEYEPHYNWAYHGPFGWIEIYAHPDCARKKMPYGNFEEIIWDWPKEIPEGVPMPIVARDPCKVCGDVPTLEDARRVAGRLYSHRGPCVYCGKPIQVLSLNMIHGSMTGEHYKSWHYKNWVLQPSIEWHGYLDGKRTLFSGHFSCGIKAMPSIKWQELERVFIELEARKNAPIKQPLRRFLTRRIGVQVGSMFRVDWSHLLHIVEATLMDLDGPREWVPGWRRPRLVFEGDFRDGTLKAKVQEEE